MNNKFALFLTGCINPNGMAFTKLQDANLRKRQYIEAIRWYYFNTTLPIVFVENSDTDISKEIDIECKSGRIEFLAFEGNNYDKSLGKGYGEGLIIQYAFKNSLILPNSSVIIKITGRLIVENINDIVDDYNRWNSDSSLILCDFNRKLTVAFSRIVFMPRKVWIDHFIKKIHFINDTVGYEFENALADAIVSAMKTNRYHLSLFRRQYLIKGISGTDGISIKNKSIFTIYMKYFLYRMHLWGKISGDR